MLDNHRLEGDAMLFLNEMRPSIETMLCEELIKQHGIKYSLVLTAKLEKVSVSVGQVYDDHAQPNLIMTIAYFQNEASSVLNQDDSNVQVAIALLLSCLDEYTNERSGWRLKRVVVLDLGIARYQPFRARSYFLIPKCIPPHSVIKVKNDGNRCFEWAILSALYTPITNANQTAKYRNHLGKFNFDGMIFLSKQQIYIALSVKTLI